MGSHRMAKKFEDIKIVGLDEDASGPSGQGSLMNLVLRLSQVAPAEWAEYFNQAWKQHIYMMKRRAEVFGRQLEIIAMPSEMQSDHIPELNKVISDTNEAYKKYIGQLNQAEAAEEAKKAEEKKQISDLKNSLKFD